MPGPSFAMERAETPFVASMSALAVFVPSRTRVQGDAAMGQGLLPKAGLHLGPGLADGLPCGFFDQLPVER